jgi:hypothetical protein
MARKFCKHYQAMAHNETCKVGIAYKDLPHAGTKEFHAACPCFGPEGTGECPCKLYPTPGEMEAEDKRLAEKFVGMAKARNAIVDSLGGPWKRGTPGASGTIDCPVCLSEKKLQFSRSGYNGHIHAGCSTDGCVRWME